MVVNLSLRSSRACLLLSLLLGIILLGGAPLRAATDSQPAPKEAAKPLSTKQKLLRFFFDGVPDESGTTPAKKSAANEPEFPDDYAKSHPGTRVRPGYGPDDAAKIKSNHKPFVDQQCTECHNIENGGNTAGMVPALCYKCHTNFLEKKKVLHQAVEMGECLACHAPHQAENPKLLLKLGREMCIKCHIDPVNIPDDQAPQAAKPIPAPTPTPVSKPSPTPNASPTPKTSPAPSSSPATKTSAEPSVPSASPLPKAFPTAKALPGSNDLPVADELAPITSAIPLIEKEIPVNPKENPKLTNIPRHKAKVVHPPVAADCAQCHDPHGADNKGLLKKPLPETCFSCHKDFRQASKIKHDPAANGECTACHTPHASDNKGLLSKPGSQVCLDCHDKPAGKSVHPPAESECLECHSPHGSDIKGMLSKPLTDTCFSCHEDFRKTAKFKHDPAAQGECLSCHKPHASDNKGLLVKPSSQICLECHDNPTASGKVKHDPAANGDCLECHDPHGSNLKGFLKKPAPQSCFGCHEDFLKPMKFKHDPAGNGECLSCHAAHQSENKNLLIKTGPALCYECHDKEEVAKVRPHVLHPGKDCLFCHNPHGGDSKKFLKTAAHFLGGLANPNPVESR